MLRRAGEISSPVLAGTCWVGRRAAGRRAGWSGHQRQAATPPDACHRLRGRRSRHAPPQRGVHHRHAVHALARAGGHRQVGLLNQLKVGAQGGGQAISRPAGGMQHWMLSNWSQGTCKIEARARQGGWCVGERAGRQQQAAAGSEESVSWGALQTREQQHASRRCRPPGCLPTPGCRSGPTHLTALPAESIVPPSHSWEAAVRSLQQ